MKHLLIFCLSQILVLFSAYANDTAATISAGNVTFKKSKEISMESEKLTISPERTHVEYVFRNLSKTPIEDTVVFPLPDSSSVSGWGGGLEMLEGKNALNFVLRIDGKPKPVEVHAKKVNVDAEQSDIFSVEAFYSWRQLFPAEKTIEVEHEYDTGAGSGGSTSFSDAEKKKYCIDDTFLKAFEKMKPRIHQLAQKKFKQDSPGSNSRDLATYMHYNSFSHVSYILKTANNWAGPIKRFKLKLKKDKPSTLVSVCWDGLKKISDTEFEATKENFSPESDLDVLFVHER